MDCLGGLLVWTGLDVDSFIGVSVGKRELDTLLPPDQSRLNEENAPVLEEQCSL